MTVTFICGNLIFLLVVERHILFKTQIFRMELNRTQICHPRPHIFFNIVRAPCRNTNVNFTYVSDISVYSQHYEIISTQYRTKRYISTPQIMKGIINNSKQRLYLLPRWINIHFIWFIYRSPRLTLRILFDFLVTLTATQRTHDSTVYILNGWNMDFTHS